MSFIDVKYINLVSSKLLRFSRKKQDLYSFRCPYCGDSSKNRTKTRGYFYRVKNDFFFKCHNCSVGKTLGNFLKDNDPLLYDEYIMERYKSGLTGKGTNTPNPTVNFEKPKFSSNLSGLVSIFSLDDSHPAKKYLLDRKIPEEKLKELYFCKKFKSWVNNQKQTFDNVTYDHARIIIPLKSDNKWFGFQGRSLTKSDKLRYITIILDEIPPKIYNLDGVNYSEKVYITEGPLDSIFLKNSIAMVGADVDWKFLLNNPNTDFVFVYDNEPRNKQIVERMQKVIDAKVSVVIWPSNIKEKDINDMILAGYSPQEIIEANTFEGLEAQIKFNDWKKV